MEALFQQPQVQLNKPSLGWHSQGTNTRKEPEHRV